MKNFYVLVASSPIGALNIAASDNMDELEVKAKKKMDEHGNYTWIRSIRPDSFSKNYIIEIMWYPVEESVCYEIQRFTVE